MAVVVAGTFLVLFLPFLLSLAGQGGKPKIFTLIMGVVAVLLSVEDYWALAPWTIGMAVAILSIWRRIQQRGSAPAADA